MVFVLVVSALSFNYFPFAYPNRPVFVNVASGLVTAVLFFASVLLHEMSHSLVAKAGGTGIRKITLFVFGGVAQMEEEPKTPGREFVMAVAGPGMSLLIAAASFATFFVLWRVADVSNVWWAPFEYLAIINVGVAVFNLLPGFPLDGGRVLRAGLWAITGDLLESTRWASGIGRALGFLMMLGGVAGILMGQVDMVWLAVLGWFLTTMASNAYRDQRIRSALADVPVGSLMSSPVTVVPGDMSVQQLVDDYFLGGAHTQYPVVSDGRVVGVLHMGAARRVPRELWASTTAAELASQPMTGRVVDARESVGAILSRFGPDGGGAVLVASSDRLVGIVTRADVIRAINEQAQSASGGDPA